MNTIVAMADERDVIRFCTAQDGVRLAFARCGRGAGLPVVRTAHFLTNLEGDLASPVWGPWIAELSRGNTLWRYDGRGCGLSDRSPSELSLDAWVGDLESVVDAAGLERFALFGCSQGAAVSVAYAARHPERVSCLVLLGGFVRGALRRDSSPEQIREAQLLLDMVEVGWGLDNPAYRQVFTSQFIPDGSPEQVRWFNDLERLSCSPTQAGRILRAIAQFDAVESARHVECPTLVLHARGDARVPFDEGRLVAGLIPDARFVPVDSRNHILLRSESAFAHAFGEIRDFVRMHAGGATTAAAFASLTTGERDLVELLAQGLDNLQIAARLELSEKTVRNKVSAVFSKLQVESRAQAIVRARDAGFGFGAAPR